jgi:hypothetical protein
MVTSQRAVYDEGFWSLPVSVLPASDLDFAVFLLEADYEALLQKADRRDVILERFRSSGLNTVGLLLDRLYEVALHRDAELAWLHYCQRPAEN